MNFFGARGSGLSRSALALAVAAVSFSAGVSAQKQPGNVTYVAGNVEVASDSGLRVTDERGSGRFDPSQIAGDWYYIVQLSDAPVAQYRGEDPRFAAPGRLAARPDRLDPRSAEARRYSDHLQQQQLRFVDELRAQLGRAPNVLDSFQYAFNGVVLRLSKDDLGKVRRHPSVRMVEPLATYQLNTDVGPAFIGADQIWAGGDATGGAPGSRGEGVVVGIIDSGVNWQSPSFADVSADGYDHGNPLGTGNYLGLCDGQVGPGDPVNGPACNDKVIGAYANSFEFVQQVNFECSNPDDPTNELGLTPAICADLGIPLLDLDRAVDENGHGSHTASTAAGNVVDITYRGNNLRISGVAPRANLVVYDTCHTNVAGRGSCFNIATVAAIEQAVQDGVVDVINYSIGGGAQPWTEAGSLAFLAAVDAGIFVAASAGNSGPGAETLGHLEPWVMTVANGTHSRAPISFTYSITGPDVPVSRDLVNQPMFLGTVGGPHDADFVDSPLSVSAGINSTNDGCEPFASGAFTGAVALIRRGGCAFSIKAQNAENAGAIAVLIGNNQAGGIAPGVGQAVDIPVFGVTQVQANGLRDYAASNPGTTISIPQSAPIFSRQGDSVARSSSRGPGDFNFVKPDIIAPGTDILAAYEGAADSYEQLSGTSMSSPHVAGAAALMRALRPTWTVAEIKSALMMTSRSGGQTKEDGVTPADPFDRGAGRADLSVAALSGLVLDETPLRMQQADPASGGSPSALNLPSLQDARCIETCTFTRRVKSVASEAVTYDVSFESSSGLSATVSPSTFTIFPGTTRTLEITVDSSAATAESWNFGELRLVPQRPSVSTVSVSATPSSPAAIPDGQYEGGFGGPSMACIDIDATGQFPVGTAMQSLEVTVAANHTWIGDLILKLRNPAGSVLGLLSRPGFAETEDDGAELNGGVGADFAAAFPITFSDNAFQSAESMGSVPPLAPSAVVCGAAGSTCEYAPAPGATPQPPSKLADFVGESADGVWTLCAGDRLSDDVGELVSVNLDFQVSDSRPLPTLHMPAAIYAVEAAPTITVSPVEVRVSLASDSAAATRQLTIANEGTADLAWEIQTLPAQATIWEQLPGGTGGIISDFFPTLAAGAYSANDFALSEESQLSVISTPGFDNADALSAQSQITWAIYPDNNGVPAGDPETNPEAALWEFTAPIGSAFVSIVDDEIRVDLDAAGEILSLPAGTYWLTVFPTYDTSNGSTRWNWSQAAAAIGEPTQLISPVLFDVADWTPLAALGVTWVDTAFTLQGSVSCGAPWLSVAPASGTVAPEDSASPVITLDPTGLADGIYRANLCIASNDPARPVVVVPVELSLGDEIFSNGFED